MPHNATKARYTLSNSSDHVLTSPDACMDRGLVDPEIVISEREWGTNGPVSLQDAGSARPDGLDACM